MRNSNSIESGLTKEPGCRVCVTYHPLLCPVCVGPLLYGPLKILQQYELHQCGHQEPLPAIHCIHKLARRQRKNNLKYIIATQV